MKQLKLRLATPDFKVLVELSRSIAASVGPFQGAEPEQLAAFILARALQLFDSEPGMLELFFSTHPILRPARQADAIADRLGEHAGPKG
ncbi:MAG: hypothetical protein DWB45_04970 [Xanthomonadales bacterium]|nr:hypothetical protein [Xanthomonadales bacterium]MDL1869080.1 hypothetical protein [Gammaproteobacteria bacterium PRO6]